LFYEQALFQVVVVGLFGFDPGDVECRIGPCIDRESAFVFPSRPLGAEALQLSTRGLRCS
jgi:hypothetical protein